MEVKLKDLDIGEPLLLFSNLYVRSGEKEIRGLFTKLIYPNVSVETLVNRIPKVQFGLLNPGDFFYDNKLYIKTSDILTEFEPKTYARGGVCLDTGMYVKYCGTDKVYHITGVNINFG